MSVRWKVQKSIECVSKDILGTPHTLHYAAVVLALNASKPVLCEKPFTTNAAELKSLIALAKEKNVFLMEAMWTRFLPVATAIKKVITDGRLGELRVLYVNTLSNRGLPWI
jgi:predicted dehydrogenase